MLNNILIKLKAYRDELLKWQNVNESVNEIICANIAAKHVPELKTLLTNLLAQTTTLSERAPILILLDKPIISAENLKVVDRAFMRLLCDTAWGFVTVPEQQKNQIAIFELIVGLTSHKGQASEDSLIIALRFLVLCKQQNVTSLNHARALAHISETLKNDMSLLTEVLNTLYESLQSDDEKKILLLTLLNLASSFSRNAVIAEKIEYFVLDHLASRLIDFCRDDQQSEINKIIEILVDKKLIEKIKSYCFDESDEGQLLTAAQYLKALRYCNIKHLEYYEDKIKSYPFWNSLTMNPPKNNKFLDGNSLKQYIPFEFIIKRNQCSGLYRLDTLIAVIVNDKNEPYLFNIELENEGNPMQERILLQTGIVTIRAGGKNKNECVSGKILSHILENEYNESYSGRIAVKQLSDYLYLKVSIEKYEQLIKAQSPEQFTLRILYVILEEINKQLQEINMAGFKEFSKNYSNTLIDVQSLNVVATLVCTGFKMPPNYSEKITEENRVNPNDLLSDNATIKTLAALKNRIEGNLYFTISTPTWNTLCYAKHCVHEGINFHTRSMAQLANK